MARHPMTKEGETLLNVELKRLKSVERHKVVKAIASARELGDLKENSEYHAAKEQQGFIEHRIRDIESKLSDSQVIDVTLIEVSEKVIFGSTVNLQNLDTNKNTEYKLVGKDEADLKKKLIFFQSPIGKGLIGKKKNDLVEISTPAGIKNFEIIDVKYI